MRIKYNAPFTLTFSLVAAVFLVIDQVFSRAISQTFAVPGQGFFSWNHPYSYVQLFSHVLVHANWEHFIGNFSFILLLGPVLEEKYQTLFLALMVLVTALLTGILNVLFSHYSLAGASGIVFLMIMLISFTNIRSGEIPLSFVLIVILYLCKEVFAVFNNDNVAHFIHIIGGVLGSVFGFWGTWQQTAKSSKRTESSFIDDA